MDWYLPPRDKFDYETKFKQLTSSPTISLLNLDPIYKQNLVTPDEFLLIFQLVNIKQDDQLNITQFVYFMHILNQKRRGFEIPSGIPLNVKQSFLTTAKQRPQQRGNDLKDQMQKLQSKLNELKDDLELLEKVSDYQCTIHFRNEFQDDLQELRALNRMLDNI